MYAILDIETTGGNPATEKITEIAFFFFDGEQVVDEWVTLINPEKSIPYYITGLTGITNEMVADAPRFYEIAREIVERTENHTIVGHNVKFDYAFIRSEFKRLGYDYKRETLCTVSLSRKLLPGHKSYSLGKLCSDLGIQIKGRHRASGDAMATLKLFELLQKANGAGSISLTASNGIKYRNINENLSVEDLEHLPELAGIYYFSDENHQLIYIGKSKNIKHRVLSHLGNVSSKRAIEMRSKICSISYELTGSELVALIKESEEIKDHKPFYNRLLKRSFYYWGLYTDRDGYGYMTFSLKRISETPLDPIMTFNNKKEAREYLTRMVEKYWLCQKLSGLYNTDGACFHYTIRQCNGACVQKEPVSIYNRRAGEFLDSLKLEKGNMLIIDQGREPEERSVIRIENGMFTGYGFISVNESYLTIDGILDCIVPSLDNRDIRQILKNYMKNNRVEKILYY
ncbi:MAG: GIY-YIG nuclease family protein [Bacteroidales bacterium]|nr:GIY-YIG nuclease family protein [Bacteroidales bacterium]